MKLKIAQMLLDESSFSHRADFLQLPPNEAQGSSSVAIQTELSKANNGAGAIVRLRVGNTDDKTALYRFTVSYLVIFEFEDDGTPAPNDVDDRLMVTGAYMAYPFVRECVANLTTRGRFGPIWLAPMDFNGLLGPKTPPQVAANTP